MLEQYGVVNAFQLEEVKVKSKATMLAQHGVEHPSQSKELKLKAQATSLAKYGTKHPLASDEVRAKIAETNQARYGAENVFASSIIQERIKETMLSKHGVEFNSQRPEVRAAISSKVKQRFIEAVWDERVKFLEQAYSVKLLTSKDEYLAGAELRWRHVCGHEYVSSIDGSNDIARCKQPGCQSVSAPHRELYEHVRSITQHQVVINDRAVLKPYELDIYLPDDKLAIELDGIYWHQDEACGDKLERCAALGIQLLHITDLSWYQHKAIWKSIIVAKLGLTEKLMARKCKLRELTKAEAAVFFNENHLQGSVGCELAYGLFYDAELVAAMSFGKPRFNKAYEWELLRYASKLNLSVLSGASRLLKRFIVEHAPKSIISYAKREHSQGKLYSVLGFRLLSSGAQSFSYLKNGVLLSRYQVQKHKLPELLGSQHDASKSARANLEAAGYIKVPDRGSMTFGLQLR
jgi:hypothetical protein